jgi:acetyl-CoA C-acetyltransferase
MPEALIFDAVRSPRGRGKTDGSLHEVTSLELMTQMLRAIRDRNALDTARVDDIVLGVVSGVGEQGSDIARIAALNADYSYSVPGVQIDRYCSSGLDACNIAAAKVIAGEGDLMIGGGVDSMSRVPMGSAGGPWSVDPSIAFKSTFVPQGISADLVATLYGFDRTAVDSFAVESQRRAKRAWDEGRFVGSIVPIKDQLGLPLLERDEHLRPETTVESLSKLRPSFAQMGQAVFDDLVRQRFPEIEQIEHVHHAGNSSGIVDGASAVLIGSKSAGDKLPRRARARIRAMASVGSDPVMMLTGPEFVTAKVLQRAGMTTADIDLWEINEAFASVALRFIQAMDLNPEHVNVNGGAIAMGHPLGATGAMLLGTVLDELERQDKQTALITLCVGAGMGTATIIERC